MSRRIFAILITLLVGAAFLIILGKNRALRREIAVLEIRLAGSNGEAGSKVRMPTEDPAQLGRSEKLELMRLRAEVTQLRSEMRQLSAERATTQTDSSLERFSPPIPVEKWVRAGAATPEDAAQSLVNYLFKLNTSTNEIEIVTNHPPSLSSFYPQANREAFTNATALTASLLERADEIVSLQMGRARPGVGIPGENDFDRMVYSEVPIRINYADGTSSTQHITLRAGTTFENGQINPAGSWSPRIKFEMIGEEPRVSF